MTAILEQPRQMASSVRPVPRPRGAARVVWALSGLNLAIVVGVLILLFVVSERWWVGTAVTYLPRLPWGVPAVVLSAAALIWHRPSLWINLLSLLLVAGPILEFRAPFLSDHPTVVVPADAVPLRIVSANTQGYKPDFASLLQEIARFKPDVVALQEARGTPPLVDDVFPGWHRLHVDYYWVGSRYPIKLVAKCDTEAFDRPAGILVEIETPQGPVLLADLHQMTARRGLKGMAGSELLTGAAQSDLDGFQTLRQFESDELRGIIQQHVGDRPLIVVGDFNTPASSSLFQQTWGDLQSAYDVAGVGYGYTSPVKPQKYWVSYLPWARIDHILCSADWQVRMCQVGRRRGSDHHCIAAELAR
ncbi:MAG: endonuclease/exonuclease/phosphatase family protein [Planctomycetaceae bacterium]|nr:endonuclease/exonuclease/phosphatase family protein [Planctomycetaceae bacterium]